MYNIEVNNMPYNRSNFDWRNKKLVIFDLDGTLAESKSELDEEMANLISDLMKKMIISVISGGSFKQFEKQFLPHIGVSDKNAKRLLLFPTCASSFYIFRKGAWIAEYNEVLKDEEKKKIYEAFSRAFADTAYKQPVKFYGEVIEDRGSQITFSALGQEAPISEKSVWDPDLKKRKKLVSSLEKYLPEFEIRIGGSTSIDITHKGIDKAYGVRQIEKVSGVPLEKMFFIGDKLQPGGNDYPAREAGIDWVEVSGPEETKGLIREILR